MTFHVSLLARYRRPWGLVVLASLAVPLVVQIMQPSAVSSDEEARMLSDAPPWPKSPRDWLALPRKLDRFVADHFGLRSELVRAHGRLRYAIDLPSDLRVLIGRDNWLFLNGDGTIEQATGKVLREAEIAKFADRAAVLRARLAAKGTQLLVAIPPNGPTINRARLPAWAAEAPAVTEYDLMMRALRVRGVAAVDLRPPLLAASAPTYRRTDTHWNKLGALIAYNAVVNAVNKSGWTIEPARVLRGFEPVAGGDLARLLAIAGNVSDEDARIDLSAYGPPPPAASPIATQFESGGDLVESGRAGPTVLVIGDSFTRGFWQDYFAMHAGRYVWMHHEQCGFALSVVETYAPEVVILAPTERQMFCTGR
jgi:alginate O-acetyltransferase complex protein AlgJ